MAILITGGAGAGKTSWAEAHFPDREIIRGYHREVRGFLLEGEDPLAAAERLLEEKAGAVVVMDELGCGIVPMDPFERKYREVNGRVACLIAERAEQVIRVVCGIGTRIK